jgi:exopolyphosphatase/guanosine-5'-triphosphate,3'-diphosphate pyrophosphatase
VRRIAAIDVGSNSVLLLVAELGPDGAVRRVDEDLRLTRLGRGIGETGRLDPVSVRDTLAALVDFRARAEVLGASRVIAVGTAALRDVGEGAAAFLEAAHDLGVTIELVGGAREAALSTLAVRRSLPGLGDNLVVLDCGGRSTEVTRVEAGGAVEAVSLPLGAVGLTEACLPSDPPGAHELAAARASAASILAAAPRAPAGAPIVAAGGTATTLAAVLGGIEPYDPDLVHGARLTAASVVDAVERLAVMPLRARLLLPGLSPGRADVALGGAVVLEQALATLGRDELTVSDRGVRWALAYEALAGEAESGTDLPRG